MFQPSIIEFKRTPIVPTTKHGSILVSLLYEPNIQACSRV